MIHGARLSSKLVFLEALAQNRKRKLHTQTDPMRRCVDAALKQRMDKQEREHYGLP